jgi:hypothetical protein
MTLSEIVSAINAQLAVGAARRLEAANVLASDALGTNATEATFLDDLHDAGGTNLGVADGDVFTISGVRDDGSSFFREWTVSDASTQTLGTLRTQIASAVGADVVLDVRDGRITATAVEDGSSAFSIAVSSNNGGGGTFSLGALAAVEAGRGISRITAADVGGQLSLAHADYGSTTGFTIGLSAGGADGTGSLGLLAGTHAGTDVAGTIGGHPATGSGRLLTGNAGFPAEGLIIEYSGTALGAVGSMTFSRGIGSLMEKVVGSHLSGDHASIQGIVDRLDTQKRGIDQRIERFEERLDFRAANLTKQFAALEEAMAQAQQEMSWLQAQLGSLNLGG